MKKLEVKTILKPSEEGVAPEPFVAPGDRITEAMEVMLKNDLKRIAVVQGDKVLGMIRLEDALRKVGLDRGIESKGTQSLVVQGRKIIVKK